MSHRQRIVCGRQMKQAFRVLFFVIIYESNYFAEGSGMEKEVFRVRDRQLKIWVTDYEYQIIQERMKASRAGTLREFLVEAATNGVLVNVDYSDIKTLAYEINRIGNNINQIAHRINSEGIIYRRQIEDVQADVDLIWKLLRAKFYQIP